MSETPIDTAELRAIAASRRANNQAASGDRIERAANEIDRLTSALSAANERAERLAEFAKTLNNNYREGDAMMLVREIDTTDRGHVLQCDCIPNFKDIPNQRVREFLTTFGDVLKFAGYIQTVDKRRLPALADTPEPPATGATA